jgi:predicted nucleotidyltransferase
LSELRVDLEPEKFVLLEAVAKAADALGIRWLLTGAGGRILLLERLRGLPPGKATEDLDFGVMVRSWEEYRDLRNQICRDLRFREDPKAAQRLLFGDSAMLDLVPFGPIGVPDDAVRWPSDEGVVMNVLGFQEASDTALPITVNGRLAVPIATPQAMLLLKFIAWEDRHARLPGKDASDIAYILYHGETIIGLDALYEEYPEPTEAVDSDLDLASAIVFGLQMGALAQSRTKSHLLAILNRELVGGEDSLLVREVAAGVPGWRWDTRKALVLIQQVRIGFMGEVTP